MPMPALLLLLATLLPLLSFAILFFLGNRMGNPLSGWVATGCVGGSFALSMGATIAWFNTGQMAGLTWGPGDKPIDIPLHWLFFSATPTFDFDIYIDSLTIALFNALTMVLLLVHVFAVGFLTDQSRFWRFFTRLSLVTFSILGLMLGGNLFHTLVFWEFLGIAAWPSRRRRNPDAESRGVEIIAFLINRSGDFAFLAGVGILFHFAGNSSFALLTRWMAPGTGADLHLANGGVMPARMLTLSGIGFLWGALSRACQLPLRTWLTESALTPSPAGALFQSVTFTGAAVFLTARLFPILTPDAKLFISIVGLVTLLAFNLLAVFQRDIRLILAFSVMGQAGLMLMAVAIGSWAGGLFQFMSYTFFGTLLLLSAGSVTRAARGRCSLDEFGGWIGKMPVTGASFAVAILAISAVPFTSGYYSIEMIQMQAGALAALALSRGLGHAAWVFFMGIALCTALAGFLMTRCWMLIFLGKPRNVALHQEARERASLWFPLLALSVVTLLGGSRLLSIKHFLVDSANETENYSELLRSDRESSAGIAFSRAWPVDAEQASDAIHLAMDKGDHAFHTWGIWAYAVGILPAIAIYARRGRAEETAPAGPSSIGSN